MYIKRVVRSLHYKECHEKEIPFWEVLVVIVSVKNPKKVGDSYVYKTEKYYITAKKIKDTLVIKNAKRIK